MSKTDILAENRWIIHIIWQKKTLLTGMEEWEIGIILS